jgi:hypothetical protein
MAKCSRHVRHVQGSPGKHSDISTMHVHRKSCVQKRWRRHKALVKKNSIRLSPCLLVLLIINNVQFIFIQVVIVVPVKIEDFSTEVSDRNTGDGIPRPSSRLHNTPFLLNNSILLSRGGIAVGTANIYMPRILWNAPAKSLLQHDTHLQPHPRRPAILLFCLWQSYSI